MNKFVDMTTFVAVVDAKSISEAAKRLGIAKSVVSQRIQQLEKRLNTRLFERGRKLIITQSGYSFYERCIHILEEIEIAETEATTNNCHLTGRLRLSVPMAFTERYLASILAKFAIEYPDLELDIEATDNFVNLNDENFDAAIRLGRLNSSSLIAKKISVNRHVLCASPRYLELHGVPEHPNDLQDHEGLLYILREHNGMLQLPVEGELQSFRIRNRMRTNSGHQLLAAAMEGLGVTILPTFIAAEYIESEVLSIVLPKYTPLGGDISVIHRQGHRNSNKITVLVNYLRESIGYPPIWDQIILKKLQEIDYSY
ncbi:LysR family transcriptional regulator [Acinetobacter oleivorans]|uniref:LysR family transcriptional regulator n=1 Tax=Acinetobacter oleivorans TaxID=1148157 RepID=UPI000D31D583|nr:LysR family transcriptional regulator [Acinetobacter oleivorans]PTV48024.1 LysR family transcriptional regulator [Acinetobacter oleivorans]